MAGRHVAHNGTRAEDWLVGGGEMGKLVRSMDWSTTPLGPIESWPQSLRTTVSLCLASNFPISLAWGPKHVQIYNDGYWPICGGKHPHSVGQDFSECWASAWPVIGEAFERALAGETSYLENQRMFLDRNGYLEETFFTFSFSPIRDETGGVGGLFHPVTETTSKMLSERRTRALRDLTARAGKAQTTREAFALAAETMAELDLDLPFVMFYQLNAEGTEARLIAQTGSLPDAIAMPTTILDASSRDAWPLLEVARSGETHQADDLEAHFGPFSCGPYPETPKTALALPIILPGQDRPVAILIAGVSSRLPLNDAYRAFYDLLAAAVTAAAANAQAYEEERQRAETLAELDRAKTAFFSNVSHEFRTPLTLMLGPLEDELGERASPLPPARRERLETAHRNTLRLLKLVNTLLDFSRIEAGRMQATYEMTDLAAYTTELASSFRSAVEKGGLTLTVDCPPLPEPVYVDRDMWEKIVLNLLSNAFKHTFDGGIRVALRWRGDHAELTVADSGVGIAAAELPRLFDRFHRVKGAKSRTHEGTGIGLALVQELIRAHGGTVRVESREGQGSTFTVTVQGGHAHLPVERLGSERTLASTATRADVYVEEALRWVADGPPASTAPSLPANGNGASGHHDVVEIPTDLRPRILWADDNADMRDYVRRLLAEHYEVTAVPDGTTAVAAALAAPPDLVLTDVMMPGLDGFGVLRELRADERTRTVPVILLSARAGEEAAVEGLDAGADDYLVKPFAARELLARVRTHLELAKMRQEWAVELEVQVEERTEAEREARREAEAANRAKSRFLAVMSHELRTPLNAIGGHAQLLGMELYGPLTAQQQEALSRIDRSQRHLLSLITDVLDFARIEAGKVECDIRAVRLGDVVAEATLMLEPQLAAKHLTCDVRLPARPVVVRADREKLQQILLNVLSNAIKFTPAGGRILLDAPTRRRGEVSTRASMALVRISDTGCGIPRDKLAAIFDPFVQVDASLTRPAEGVGLGLAISRDLARAMGGDLRARSVVGKGSSFTLALQRAGLTTPSVSSSSRSPSG